MTGATARLRDSHPGEEPAAPERTAAVVLLTRDVAQATRLLPGLLPGRAVLEVGREALAGAGPWGAASILRSLPCSELVFLVDDLDAHERLWRVQALGAAAAAVPTFVIDLQGRRVRLSPGRFLGRDLPRLAAGLAASAGALLYTAGRVQRLVRTARHHPRPATDHRVVYLRTDFWAGIRAGGSVGHTAGVASGLAAAGGQVSFIASSRPGAIGTGRYEVRVIAPRRLYNVGREEAALAYSLHFERRAAALLAADPPGFLYQRFDPANHAGVALARRLDVPLVLEFNGSEVWIADHWGRPLRRRSLHEGIETVNLRHADLVSVVSEALKDDVLARGVDPGRVAVLPNGVDPGRYHPDRNGSEVRARHGLHGFCVCGFIGTFGVWHGAQVMARAAARVLVARPQARFLFVGDGVERGAAESILAQAGVLDRARFTGLVAQEDGPDHLAAMDILVAPHVANADGSRFFGSPTKLFEYMAMGRAIVASRLEQMGDVLEDGRTAVLVPPGDEAALAAALLRLVDRPDERDRLGRAARAAAVSGHTWESRARALLSRLRDMGLVRWS
jgi:glycosyltransferase involved in cell wall biosynthesis